jgi:hypothetical protein
MRFRVIISVNSACVFPVKAATLAPLTGDPNRGRLFDSPVAVYHGFSDNATLGRQNRWAVA